MKQVMRITSRLEIGPVLFSQFVMMEQGHIIARPSAIAGPSAKPIILFTALDEKECGNGNECRTKEDWEDDW